MSNVILTLGGVPFQEMEVPEKISFGGTQRLAVQNLIGDGRVVEALGSDNGFISFSGIFSGSDAVSRAQSLDAARSVGAVLPLVWDSFFYNVIIETFSAEYRKTNLIPFSVRCVVTNEISSSSAGANAPLENLIANDLSAASVLSSSASVSLSGLGPATISGFSLVQSTIVSSINSNGAALNICTAALNDASDSSSGISTVNALCGTSLQLAALAGMSGYINRAANNLASNLS